MTWSDPNRYDDEVARALATPGGHLGIGRGGAVLHYDESRLEWLCYRILAQECWPILVHLRSLNLRCP